MNEGTKRAAYVAQEKGWWRQRESIESEGGKLFSVCLIFNIVIFKMVREKPILSGQQWIEVLSCIASFILIA